MATLLRVMLISPHSQRYPRDFPQGVDRTGSPTREKTIGMVAVAATAAFEATVPTEKMMSTGSAASSAARDGRRWRGRPTPLQHCVQWAFGDEDFSMSTNKPVLLPPGIRRGGPTSLRRCEQGAFEHEDVLMSAKKPAAGRVNRKAPEERKAAEDQAFAVISLVIRGDRMIGRRKFITLIGGAAVAAYAGSSHVRHSLLLVREHRPALAAQSQ